MEKLSNFEWTQQKEADNLILDILEKAVQKNPFLSHLQDLMKGVCSTELIAWVDHLLLPKKIWQHSIEKVGFTPLGNEGLWRHLGAKLPDIALSENEKIEVAIAVDSIAEFLEVHGLYSQIEGYAFSEYRKAICNLENGVSVSAVERRGTYTLSPTWEYDLDVYFACKELWMIRNRSLNDEEEGINQAIDIAKQLVQLLQKDAAACLVLECERRYWQFKNTAAQIQKNRQDRIGLGWANHDHHTFRSSRKHFAKLVQLFEILGFHCRERFYAGKDAGWGAQVMENPISKLVLFLDVDLSPEEVGIDFAHEILPSRKTLGTIGLWCALHGDSILHAGMHHLEAQFNHDQLTEDLHHLGIRMMDPFSNFPYLKQAFTQGEVWKVDLERLSQLESQGLINAKQKEQFITHGAIGSHMENLQRKEGYKGFNKDNVSVIIKKTHPLYQPEKE